MAFTAAELAEIAKADAEIEASFHLSNEDLALSREMDREARMNQLSPEKRKVAEYQRAYREANKDKLAEYKRAYYEANKDKVAEYQRAYYEKNREKILQGRKKKRCGKGNLRGSSVSAAGPC